MAEIKKISTELQPLDKLLDTSGDAGTSGQILTSTGTGTNWVAAGTPGTGVYLPLVGGTLSGPGNLTVSGTTNLLSTLTVAGVTTLANTGYLGDGLGSVQYTLQSANDGFGTIDFGDVADVNIGRLAYSHVDDSFSIRTNNATALTLDSSQNAEFGGTISSGLLTTTVSSGSNIELRKGDGYGALGFGGTSHQTGLLEGVDGGGLKLYTAGSNVDWGGAWSLNTTWSGTGVTFAGSVTTGGELTFSNNNTGITMKDASGTTTRVFRLNSGNTMYIGPIDTYAGGEIFYGAASEVTGHRFYVGAAAKLTIDSSGNSTFAGSLTTVGNILTLAKVGIGTASPQSFTKLDVRSGNVDGDHAIVAYAYNGVGGVAITGHGYATNNTHAGSSTGIRGISNGGRTVNGSINIGGQFTASGAANNYAIITTAGNVGINNTTPTFALDVIGTARVSGNTEFPTQSTSDDSTKVATTAFVKNILAEQPAGLTFLGNWNADTNSPTLVSGGGELADGAATSVAANKLNDTNATFQSDNITVNADRVRVVQANGNIAFSVITVVNSNTQLTLTDDIATTVGDTYIVEKSPFLSPEGGYYIVGTSGDENLNGITDWVAGDWVLIATTNVFQKIDNTSILSGAGAENKVTQWASSSGDPSVTLASGPITFSTNDSTFAGNITLTGDGKLLKFTPTSYDDVELGIDSNGFVIYNTTDTRYDLKINGDGNATFASDINITRDILPVTTGASDLGTDAKRFGSLFTNGGFIGTLTSTNIQLIGNLKILNKAQSAYIGFATRNTSGSETVMDITNAGSATFAGDVEIGVADGGERKLRIHGGATGTPEGGQIELHTAADYDSTYAFYRIDAYEDDLRIGRAGTTDWQLNSSGYVGAANRLGVGTLDPNNILQVVGNMTIGTGATNETVRTIQTGGTIVLQATDANHRIIIRGTQDAAGAVTGNSNNMDFYEYGGYSFYTGVDTSTSARTLALSMASNGNATFANLVTVGPGTTGSPYDVTTFLHVKGTTRSIVQQSSTADAYYMFGDAAANNVAWLGYDHSSNQLSLHTSGTTNIDGDTTFTGTVISPTLLVNTTAVRESASKLSVQGGMSEFETTLTNGYDWANSAISINERANIGSGSADDKYAPNLNFHWSGRVSNSLWMGPNGNLNYGSYTSAGIPAVDGTFATGNLIVASAITGNTGTFTGLVSGITPVNAANFVTKAYVDGSGGGAGGPFLPLAGNTVANAMTGDINIGDNLGINWYSSTNAYADITLGTDFIINVGKSSADLILRNNSSDIKILTTGGSSDIYIQAGGDILIDDYIVHNGDTNSYFGFGAADEYKVILNNSTKIAADASSAYLYFEGTQLLKTYGGSNTTMGVTVPLGRLYSFDTDTDTGMFSDLANHIVFLAGNNNILRLESTTSTFSSGAGANGDCIVVIAADTDNTVENSNPILQLKQDGGTLNAIFGINGDANNTFTGALGNAGYLKTDGALQIAPGNLLSTTFIGSSGNVGIGTNNPLHALEVYGAARNIAITNTTEDDAGIVFRDAQAATDQAAAIKFNSSDNKLKFFVNDEVAQRMVIDTAGNVGINAVSPTKKLYVDGDAYFGDTVAIASTSDYAYLNIIVSDAGNGGTGQGLMYLQNTNTATSGGAMVLAIRNDYGSGFGNYIKFFKTGGSTIGEIYANSGRTNLVYSTSSDYRLKEDLKTFKAVDIINQIPVYDFKWKETDFRDYGVLAHEMQAVLPGLVKGDKDGEENQTVDYMAMVPILMQSIKELKAEIELLKQ